ncbi:hypothetical protein [Streptomyces sp. NPDC002516]
MSKVPENSEEMASDASGPDAGEATRAEAGSVRARPSWKQVALAAGGLAVTVAGTVVVTLVATHNSARRANAAAYAHGLLDGAEAARNADYFDEDDDYYFDEDD